MKRLFLVLLTLAPVSLWAAPAKVQCVTGTWASGTTFTASITPTTGNFLYAYAWQFGTAAVTVASVGDATNGNYTAIDTDSFVSTTTYRNATFYKANITGGALTVTTTFSASPTTGFAGSVICEFSGVALSSPLDVHNVQTQAAPGGGTNAVTSPSVTTSTNGELILGTVMSGTSGSPAFSVGTGFTLLQLCGANANCDEYEVQSSAGSIAATATSGTGSDTYMSFVATFLPAVGALPSSLMLLGIGR